jgi:integrase
MQDAHSKQNDHVHGRNYSDDAGKPGALKGARRVWRGAFGKGQRCTSPGAYPYLDSLVQFEKDGDLRGKAIFALGYWAGCRVSDIAHLRMEHAHIGPKIGWLHVGHKGGKFRDIDLLNEARRPL